MFDVDKQYDEKVDIYSFAIIMFQIITNQKYLYDGEKSGFKIAAKVLSGVRPNSSIHIEEIIQDLIENSWSKDPDVRPTAKEIFEKLAYDQEYLLDGVDIEKVNLNTSKLNKEFLLH